MYGSNANANDEFLLKVLAVLPLMLVTRLVHNWILGQFLCYVLPVLTVSSYV